MWVPAPSRTDPIGLLQEQDRTRLDQLLPVNVGKNYRKAMVLLSQTAFLDVWYYQVETDKVLEVFDQASKRAGKKNARKAGNGKRQIRNNPLLLARLGEILPEEQKAKRSRPVGSGTLRREERLRQNREYSLHFRIHRQK
ncbi:hypothetical protein [Methanosarcina siciliae]|uniref:hypothetical protein n=1 Tax=Methanosarcina siciliae TaxID=38027 RepID=UPI000AECEE2E|nr:hypothetical protein [Methanosarcina siciliae]